MEFDFIIRVRIDESLWADPAAIVNKLGEAGCTDATVGLGVPGRLALDFCRESTAARLAINSAIHDVLAAYPDADVYEIGPDFVGVSEIAGVLGVTRQAVQKVIASNRAAFPLPVHEGASAVWHLADVLAWYSAERFVSHTIREVALTAKEINARRAIENAAPVDIRSTGLSTDLGPLHTFGYTRNLSWVSPPAPQAFAGHGFHFYESLTDAVLGGATGIAMESVSVFALHLAESKRERVR